MDKVSSAEPTREEKVALEAAINQLFAEMERLNKHIQQEQEETDRLKMETRAMLTALKAI